MPGRHFGGRHHQSGNLASFSDYGPTVDVAAPGGDPGILSAYLTNPTTADNPKYAYAYMEGTSQATPQVSAVAALALQLDPKLTLAQLEDVIVKGTNPPASCVNNGVKVGCGTGIIDAMKVLKNVQALKNAPTVPTTPTKPTPTPTPTPTVPAAPTEPTPTDPTPSEPTPSEPPVVKATGVRGDQTGDGKADVIGRDSSGKLFVFEAKGQGYFGAPREIGHGWNNMDQILPVSNLAGGSTQYLVARSKVDNSLWRYEFTPTALLNGVKIGVRWGAMRSFIGVGDKNTDGRADILAIDNAGRLWSYLGLANGTIAEGKQIGQNWKSFTTAFSPGDVDGDGRWDLFGVRSDGTLWEYRNNPNGSFDKAVKVGNGFEGYKLLA